LEHSPAAFGLADEQRRGQWPTSPEISAAMFERYNKNRTEAAPSRNVSNSVQQRESALPRVHLTEYL
jgi:hypothetical protein